jgi:hypothetical protein
MVNPDGSPVRRVESHPYAMGAIDATRRNPTTLYDSRSEVRVYADGWRDQDPDRPVRNALHPGWRWLRWVRAWRRLRAVGAGRHDDVVADSPSPPQSAGQQGASRAPSDPQRLEQLLTDRAVIERGPGATAPRPDHGLLRRRTG